MLSLNTLPVDCLQAIADILEGYDLRALNLTCKCMSDPVSKSQLNRIYSDKLAYPAISHYGLSRVPGCEIESLYTCNQEDTKKIIVQLKAEGRLSEINSCYFRCHTPLQGAVISEDLEKVKVLVEEGKAKDYLVEHGKAKDCIMSALTIAASRGNADIVRYLLSQGAQVITPFYQNGYKIFIIPELIKSYCSESQEDQEVEAEKIKRRENQLQCLALILSYSKNLKSLHTQISELHDCPVEIACNHGRHDLMELLVNFGFEWPPLTQEDTREKIFINAVQKGHLESVRWFVDNYNMNINLHQNGIPLLHMAKAFRKEDIVNYLLSCGANPEALTSEGQDYQTYANLKISVRAAQALAHFFRSMAGFKEFINFNECYSCLMKHDINRVIDKKGNTLLHFAAKYPRHEYVYEKIIPALLSKGADLTARNTKGKTPYDSGMAAIKKCSYDSEEENSCDSDSEEELQEMHNRVKKLAID